MAGTSPDYMPCVGGGRCRGTVVIKLIIAFRLHGQHVRVVQWVRGSQNSLLSNQIMLFLTYLLNSQPIDSVIRIQYSYCKHIGVIVTKLFTNSY